MKEEFQVIRFGEKGNYQYLAFEQRSSDDIYAYGARSPFDNNCHMDWDDLSRILVALVTRKLPMLTSSHEFNIYGLTSDAIIPFEIKTVTLECEE